VSGKDNRPVSGHRPKGARGNGLVEVVKMKNVKSIRHLFKAKPVLPWKGLEQAEAAYAPIDVSYRPTEQAGTT
jgi:hypothetical protein